MIAFLHRDAERQSGQAPQPLTEAIDIREQSALPRQCRQLQVNLAQRRRVSPIQTLRQGDRPPGPIEDKTDRRTSGQVGDAHQPGTVFVSEVIGAQPYYNAFAASAPSMGGGGGPSIQPGQLSLTMQLQVVYEIVDAE